eukprot:m.123261 g.123261  ORF g.123261 m.123261 type:complete len:547 (+) comp37818_c0_seq4:23-1663(+)
MTILPKKKTSKATKDKSEPESDGESKGRSSPREPWSSSSSSSDEDRNQKATESRKTDGTVAAAATPRQKKKSQLKEKGDEREAAGYNSADEHEEEVRGRCYTVDDERRFEKELKEKRGFLIKRMVEDGACLFRAVADQVYGDQEMHHVVRQHCMDYMVKNRDYFSHYVTEDFTAYVNRKRLADCHGNHLEMQAMSEMFNRVIEVYQYSTGELQAASGILEMDILTHLTVQNLSILSMACTRQTMPPSASAIIAASTTIPYPIRMMQQWAWALALLTSNQGYKMTSHTHTHTQLLSLRFPQLADQMLLNDSVQASELDLIEKTMLEDKMRATDWEATGDALEEAVARESYFEWLKENEKRSRCKTMTDSGAACSSKDNPLEDSTSGERRRKLPAASAVAPTPPLPLGGAARSKVEGGGSRVRRSLSRSPRHSPYSRSPAVSPNSSPLPSPTGGSPSTSLRSSPCLQAGCVKDGKGKGKESGLEAASAAVASASEYQHFFDSVPPSVFGVGEWGDDGLLATTIAVSAQEYFEAQLNESQGNGKRTGNS